MWRSVSGLALLVSAPPACSSDDAQANPCIDLTAKADTVVTGLLTVQLFAGPPNYESIAGGDVEEKALILELPKRLCADLGGPTPYRTSFDRVHVSSFQPRHLDALNAAVGRDVTVRGEAFGAETGHHRAPLVLFAEEVVVR
jgi:hypothetical protein